MKLVWDDHEVVNHGERRHSNDYARIVENVTRGSNFYTIEIVNAIGDDLALHPLMPSGYKMITILTLRNGFATCFGLGKYCKVSLSLSKFFTKGSKFGLDTSQ